MNKKRDEASEAIKANLDYKTKRLLDALYDLEIEITKSIKLDNELDIYNYIFINEQSKMKKELTDMLKVVTEYNKRR